MKTTKTFFEDMEKVWGRQWSVNSEIGRLRAVLMHRPGKELDNIADLEAVYMKEKPDGDLARKQHDHLAEIYRSNGVEVYYVEDMDESCPNAMFCHDLILGTPEGVIVTRPGIEVRSREVAYAARAVAQLGVPIVSTIHGQGIFDGACLTWIDSKTVVIGTGMRCNEEGCRQVMDALRPMGVTSFITLSIARNQNHLDGFLSIVDRDVAVTYPYTTPQVIYDELEKRGFRIVEIPTFEEKINYAANQVALEPGKVVMAQGAPKTAQLLREAGVEVIEIDLSEIKKGGGAIHCLTAFLQRDFIDAYQ